jgi:phospho-N-acetylmuramoyl-pentapeptide-transferase
VDYLSIEFAGIPALFISFIATVVLSRIGIPIIRAKKMGQPIRDDGPESHHAKSGVPTMGGILMVIPVLLIALVFGGDRSGWLVLLGMLFLGAVGFIDDYEKLTKKQSLGLDERQKIILQVSLAAVLVVLYGLLTQQPHLQFIPFSRQAIDFSVFAYPLYLFVIVGCVNAANLTDGLDGLNSLVSLFVFFAYAWIAHLQGQVGAMVAALSFAGALIAFLFFNANPASIFMGDTGSMAIGGAVAMLSIVTKTVWFLPIIGIIYVIEAASVLIQTFYYRRTGGKRIFLMSPIHHHYELKGVPEQKIVIWFGMISLLAALLGVWMYRGVL